MSRITEQHGEETLFFFTDQYLMFLWCLLIASYHSTLQVILEVGGHAVVVWLLCILFLL